MIRVQNLNKTYQRHSKNANHVLHDISLTLPDTGFVCILGPSGCGKTSLLNAIGGLDVFDNGSITVDTVTASRPGTAAYDDVRNRSFGYIFQNYYLLPEHSVGYNVYLGLHCLKMSHREKLSRVREALKAVEMDRFIHRNVGELSGGQQQRVAIARAIARKPRIIFADEPTGNLDEANTLNICNLLRQISKTSLVIMVTHEERIANFFADRIITLSNGRIHSDSRDWQRQDLSITDADTLFAGDYKETRITNSQIRLRLLQEEGAQPVELTVVACSDRIVIKVNDNRSVQCGSQSDIPVLREGNRPHITKQVLDDTSIPSLQNVSFENIPSKAGLGIRMKDMLSEAIHINRQGGLRSIGTRIFLMLLAVLTLITVGDFLTVASVDPRDFITSDSHILTVELERGPNVDNLTLGIESLVSDFCGYLPESGHPYNYLPVVTSSATITSSQFLQYGDITTRFDKFSYVSVSHLDESTLLYGRMPENGQEVVVDKWVLDTLMAKDGILQNSIQHISQFIGKDIRYSKKSLSPVIVGICDSGEPSVYVSHELLASLGIKGTEIASLSSLQSAYPGEFDHIQLAADECLVLPENAGMTYTGKVGSQYTTLSGLKYTITEALEIKDFYPKIIVADSQVDVILNAMTSAKFHLYCQDKAAMTTYLKSIPLIRDGMLLLHVSDSYSATMSSYQKASQLRLDARIIVTFTIIVLAMVMLYLLRRSQIQKQIGLMSVYRLLGIPKGKLAIIFLLDSFMTTVVTVLPCAVAAWGVISALRSLPSIQLHFVLPWQAALWVYIAIALYHLLVTWLPLFRLLAFPPAQLAAKYDF